MSRRTLGLAGLMAAVALAGSSTLVAQTGSQSLGSVRLPKAVTANGQNLAAGSYTVRASADPVPAVVGLAPDATTWVEFVQGGQVRGKELASVVKGEAVAAVVADAPPASGSSKVQMLKGNDYLRVWINRGGTHYLVHFAVATGS